MEVAIAIPCLMAMLFLAINASAIMRSTMVAQSAAAEAARFYAANPSARTADIQAFARSSGNLAADTEVDVEPVDVPDQTYTMRLTDATGAERSTRAKTVRSGMRVTVKVPVTLLGISAPWVTQGTHVGISSVEGVRP